MTFNQWENWDPEQVKGLESDIQLAVGSGELESTPQPLIQGLFSTFPSSLLPRGKQVCTLEHTANQTQVICNARRCMPSRCKFPHSKHSSVNGVIIFLHDDISYGSANLPELRPTLVWMHHWNPKSRCLIAASLDPLRRSQKYLQGFHSRSLMIVLTKEREKAITREFNSL